MFIIDDILLLSGAGLLVLVVIGVRAARRKRVRKKLDEDDRFRDKLKEALDDDDIEWFKCDLTGKPMCRPRLSRQF